MRLYLKALSLVVTKENKENPMLGLLLNFGFIALRCTNVYMKFFIKTVPDTSLHETSDLT